MTTARTISERLEGELSRIEEEIRRTGGEAALLDRSDPHGESARMGDLYDRASATGATEMACETLIRLNRRLRDLQEALHRLREGSYGMCGDCGGPIPEKRLLAMPEATRCVGCQERHERALPGRRV